MALGVAGGAAAGVVSAAGRKLVEVSPAKAALTCSFAGWAILGAPGDDRRGSRYVRALVAAGVWTIGSCYHPNVIAGQIAAAVEGVFSAGRSRSKSSLHVTALALAGWIVGAVAVAFTLNQATLGLWRVNMVDAMKVCSFHVGFILADMRQFHTGGLCVLSGMVLTAILFWKKSRLFAAFIAAAVVELALMAKQGSGATYMAGSIALWGVPFSIAVRHLVSQDHDITVAGELRKRQAMGFSLSTVLLICGVSLTCPGSSLPHWEVPVPGQHEIAQCEQALAAVGSSRVLCLDPFYAQSHGMDYVYADAYHAGLLYVAGRIDLAQPIASLKKEQYDFVLANLLHVATSNYHGAPGAPALVREALLANYEVIYVGQWLVLCKAKHLGTSVSP